MDCADERAATAANHTETDTSRTLFGSAFDRHC
jgi:hypothetical protein